MAEWRTVLVILGLVDRAALDTNGYSSELSRINQPSQIPEDLRGNSAAFFS
jgi:hypothetical protein